MSIVVWPGEFIFENMFWCGLAFQEYNFDFQKMYTAVGSSRAEPLENAQGSGLQPQCSILRKYFQRFQVHRLSELNFPYFHVDRSSQWLDFQYPPTSLSVERAEQQPTTPLTNHTNHPCSHDSPIVASKPPGLQSYCFKDPQSAATGPASRPPDLLF